MMIQTAPAAPSTAAVVSAPGPRVDPICKDVPQIARSADPLRLGHAAWANRIARAFAPLTRLTTGTVRANRVTTHKSNCTHTASTTCAANPSCTDCENNTS